MNTTIKKKKINYQTKMFGIIGKHNDKLVEMCELCTVLKISNFELMIQHAFY